MNISDLAAIFGDEAVAAFPHDLHYQNPQAVLEQLLEMQGRGETPLPTTRIPALPPPMGTSETPQDFLRSNVEGTRANLPTLGGELGPRMQEVVGDTTVTPTTMPTPPKRMTEEDMVMLRKSPLAKGFVKADRETATAFDLEEPQVIGGFDALGAINQFMGGDPAKYKSQGGIFGLGIEPVDVLAFAIGAYLTRNMPQDQALARTFQIAGFPRALRESRRKATLETFQTKMAEMREQRAENREDRQAESASVQNAVQLHKLTQGMAREQRRESFFQSAQKGEIDLNDPKTRLVAMAAGITPQEIKALIEEPKGIKDLTLNTREELSRIALEKKITIQQAAQDPVLLKQAQDAAFNKAERLAGAKGEEGAMARDRAQSVRAVGELASVSEIVNDIDRLSTKIITSKGGAIETAKQYADLTQAAFRRTPGKGEDAALYQQRRSSFVGVLSRTLAAERGVLTEGDIQRITVAFPDFGDTVRMRDDKIKHVRNLMKSVIKMQEMIAENRDPPADLIRRMKTQIWAPMPGEKTQPAPPPPPGWVPAPAR